MSKIITCKKCGKLLSGKQVLYCSSVCKNKDYQSYNAQQARGLDRKLSLIHQLGGKCSICGYKKNSSALDFHHINPIEKSFALDLRSLSNRKQSKIDDEIKKCVLVCRNCHSEIHNPRHNLEWTSWASCSNRWATPPRRNPPLNLFCRERQKYRFIGDFFSQSFKQLKLGLKNWEMQYYNKPDGLLYVAYYSVLTSVGLYGF